MKKQLLTLFLVILLVCSSFTACGDDASLQAVIMKDQPTKTEYVIGETFDFAGATLEVTLTDGTVKTVNVTAEMLSGNLTFTKAGKQAITVIYTEGGVTKQAVIYVNVVDPATVVTPLAEAKENAKAELLAAHDVLILTTPSGKNALGEDYPALTEDLATPAKAAYDAAVAAVDAAANVAEVNAAKQAGLKAINSVDTYVDFYAAEMAARLRADFDATYVPERLFWINYAELRYNMEVLSARILRADSLAGVDALVALEEEVYANAQNTVDDFAHLLVSFSKWQLDLPTDEALDAEDADLAIFYEIVDRVEILLDPDVTDEVYAKEFIKRISNYPSSGFYAVGGNITAGIVEILEEYYDEDADAYNLFDFDFDNQVVTDCATVAIVDGVIAIDYARFVADEQDGVEDVVLAAVAAAKAEAEAGGLIYDPANADSVYNQVLAAKALFEQWVEDHGIVDYNYDLVEGYDELLALAAAYESIGDILDNAEAPTLTVPTEIILNDTVKAAIEAAEAEAVAYANTKGIPVEARYVDANGDVVYVIGNMEQLWTARARYNRLQAAKDAANAAADAEAGTEDGIAVVIINTVVGKTVVYANETATAGAVTHKAVDAIAPAFEAFLAAYEIDTFAFDGVTVDSASTIAANLDAIFGAENIAAYKAAAARSAQLADAYSARMDVLRPVSKITNADLILDRVPNLKTATEAYEEWKTEFEMDDTDAFDVESITNILTRSGVDYYAMYTENKAEIDAAVAKLNALIEGLKALKAPANIVATDRETVANLRAAFEELVTVNGDTSTDKAATAKHVVWLDADGVTTIDGYDKLCRAEATLFSIDYVVGLTADGGYNSAIKALRDTYLTAIGAAAGRADDALAINTMYSQAIAYISQNGGNDSFIASGEYDYESVVARIKAGEALVDITAEATEALDAFVAPGGEVETAIRLAARYIVTEESGVYSLTIYTPAAYDAAAILSVTGVTPDAYGTIYVKNLLPMDATYSLVGFEADEVVFDDLVTVELMALRRTTIVLQNATVGVVTVNDTAIVAVAADASVEEIVANAIAGVQYQPTATVKITAFDAIEVSADNAKVILTAKVSYGIYVEAKSIEAVIGYGQKVEDFAEGFGECEFYLVVTDAEGKLGVVIIDGLQEFLYLENANTDPDATGIITDDDHTDFDWADVEFEWDLEWTDPVQ